MKLAIISDVHLGHGSGSELSEDPYDAFREALEKSVGCDAILMAGDLFDSRTPSTETLTGGMEMLIGPLSSGNGTRAIRGLDKDLGGLTPLHKQGMPVVAIHGTHERRVRGLMNPVQALEKAGFLMHLHCSGVVLERNSERVCIQGMSGVPDQFSEAVLKKWGPRPEKGCFNVFMMHQSVSPFMYASHLLPVERLPRGFDLYVLGHVHEGKKTEYAGSPLIIPGSLVATQLTRDAVSPRGFWLFDTKTSDAAFVPLESQRKVYYIEMGEVQGDMESEISRLLEHKHDKKPLIRIKGEVPDMAGLESRFGDRAIISVRHAPRDKPPEAVGIREHAMSVQELGRKLLKENLESAGLGDGVFEDVFELLVHRKQEEALRLLSPGRQHDIV